VECRRSQWNAIATNWQEIQEELERVLDKFPKYHMKILLGYFNAKLGRKEIFKQQLGMKVYTKLVM
jgi:hypothetical protein